MAIVTIYHNNHSHLAQYRGYQSEDTVTPVFTGDLGDSGDDYETLAAVASLSDFDDDLDRDDPIVEAGFLYRCRQNRRLTAGDVVCITHPPTPGRTDVVVTTHYAWAKQSWTEVDTAPTVVSRRQAGTTPESDSALDVLIRQPFLQRGQEPGLVNITTGTHTITIFSVRTVAYVTDDATGRRVTDIDGDVGRVAHEVLIWTERYGPHA